MLLPLRSPQRPQLGFAHTSVRQSQDAIGLPGPARDQTVRRLDRGMVWAHRTGSVADRVVHPPGGVLSRWMLNSGGAVAANLEGRRGEGHEANTPVLRRQATAVDESRSCHLIPTGLPFPAQCDHARSEHPIACQISFPLTFPRALGSALRAGRRGTRGGLENRCASYGAPRVRIPPPPLPSRRAASERVSPRLGPYAERFAARACRRRPPIHVIAENCGRSRCDDDQRTNEAARPKRCRGPSAPVVLARSRRTGAGLLRGGAR